MDRQEDLAKNREFERVLMVQFENQNVAELERILENPALSTVNVRNDVIEILRAAGLIDNI